MKSLKQKTQPDYFNLLFLFSFFDFLKKFISFKFFNFLKNLFRLILNIFQSFILITYIYNYSPPGPGTVPGCTDPSAECTASTPDCMCPWTAENGIHQGTHNGSCPANGGTVRGRRDWPGPRTGPHQCTHYPAIRIQPSRSTDTSRGCWCRCRRVRKSSCFRRTHSRHRTRRPCTDIRMDTDKIQNKNKKNLANKTKNEKNQTKNEKSWKIET